MKKSVNLYFNNNQNYMQKLDDVKKIGFDEFFTGISNRTDNLTLKDQCDYASGLGLVCTMIHCKYFEPNLHYFWEQGENGDDICDDYCNQIKECEGLTQNFVVHLNERFNQQQSEYGLKRIQRMLAVCEKTNINLCIENLHSETEIPYIFKNIKHSKLKICYDIGHKHFLTPNFDIMKYSKYISVVHLHDNHGTSDEHLICGNGTVDWNSVAKELQELKGIVLTAEVKTTSKTNQVLKEILSGLQMIESLMIQ